MTLLDGAGCETDSAKRERRDYMNAPAHGSVVDGDVEEDARPDHGRRCCRAGKRLGS